MSQISQALEKGFLKYYNTLVKTGTIDKKSVDNLIVASWINDVLEGKYENILTDEQYTTLSKLYTCVEGSCLVPYRETQQCCYNTTITIPIYYGSGSNYNDFYSHKVKYNSPLKSPIGNYNVTVRHNVDYVYFLIPRSMNITKATLGGFDFPLESPVNMLVNNTEYKYYQSSNTYDISTLNIIIS